MVISYAVIAVIAFIFLFNFFYVLREYERAVVFTLGRFWKVKGPTNLIVPLSNKLYALTSNGCHGYSATR